MALNLPDTGGSGENRMPHLKYDARAGRIFRVDRSDASGQWVNDNVEITANFQAVIDLENIETGWLNFPTAAAPDIKTVKMGQPLPDRPSTKHRGGFRVVMLLGRQSGGDVREMAANAKVSTDGMDELHTAYMAAPERAQGLLPVIKLGGVKTITTSGVKDGQKVSSTNYQPVWAIVKWVPRPPELPLGGVQPEAAAAAPAAATPPTEARSAPPPPPAPAPAQQQLATVDDDF